MACPGEDIQVARSSAEAPSSLRVQAIMLFSDSCRPRTTLGSPVDPEVHDTIHGLSAVSSISGLLAEHAAISCASRSMHTKGHPAADNLSTKDPRVTTR